LLAWILGLGLLCFTMILLSNGNLAIAVAPLALALVVLAATKAALRHSLLVLAFLCLTLENPSEAFANAKWKSPLATLGALLLAHLKVTIPSEALFFSGLDLALVLLAVIWVVRRMGRSQVDLRGHIPPAPPLRRAALISLAAIGVVWLFGMVQTGFSFSDSLWQIFRVVYLPCVFLLFCAALRGPADARALGIALVCAALLRAAIAIYLRQVFPSTEELPHATTHADSMLFADAFLLVLVLFFNQPSLRNGALAAATLPLLTCGMIANNRRLVWVELGVALLALYFITPMTKLKRKLARGLVLSTPLFLLYLAVGWNSGSGVFAPARTLRSVMDSQSDTSTLWRDLENYNLYYTFRQNPVLGAGFGHPYIEVVQLPTIADYYTIYRYAPHNSILGLLTYAGVIGFAAIWLIQPLGIFFAVRSLDASRAPRDRTIALVTIGVLVVYMLHCYGDMGLGTWTSVFTVGAALALTAKLAVAVGAWPLRPRAATGYSSEGSGPHPSVPPAMPGAVPSGGDPIAASGSRVAITGGTSRASKNRFSARNRFSNSW
jgi:hypothetical protein